MRLFKATYRDRSGKQCKSAKWYGEFKDHLEAKRRVPLFKDKQASREVLHKIEQLVACKVAGDMPDPGLLRWMEVQANHIYHLGGKVRVGRTRESAYTMGLEVRLT